MTQKLNTLRECFDNVEELGKVELENYEEINFDGVEDFEESEASDGYVDSLKRYYKEMESYDLLSADEELELLKRVRENDSEAKKKLAEGNLRLVVNIAKKYGRNNREELLDYIQMGNLGLMYAINKFDPTRGCKFSSYAAKCIKGVIFNHRRELLGISSQGMKKLRMINKACSKLFDVLGREPNAEEIAKESKLSIEQVINLQMLSEDSVSLEDTISADADICFEEVLHDKSAVSVEDAAIFAERDKKIRQILLPREYKVLVLRIGLEYKQGDVAKMLNVTGERVRQLEQRAYKKLKRKEKRLFR